MIKFIHSIFVLIFVLFLQLVPGQASLSTGKKLEKADPNKIKEKVVDVASAKKLLLDIPDLIPKKIGGKFGYVDRNGKVLIKPEFYLALFYSEDCNLLNSPSDKIREFGTDEYATVEKNQISYRIDRFGKIVYQYKEKDKGICKNTYRKPLFQAIKKDGIYGLVSSGKLVIAPQYEYLHVMESEEPEYPMIIAVSGGRFGVIDINNKTIVPFEYSDIKRNFSWKLGRLFEVTKDGSNYYYVDASHKKY